MAPVRERAEIKSTLAAIAGHPTRVACFMVLAERTASPNEIAKERREDVSHIAYHVKKLLELGAIEPVDERKVRGSVEHFYRAIERPISKGRDWSDLSPAERAVCSLDVLQRHVADVTNALEAGTFDSREDRSLIRIPVLLDPEGFAKLSALHDETYERTLEIQAEAAERMANDLGGEQIPTMSTTMFYETPEKDPRKV